jgi:hypothetical protein
MKINEITCGSLMAVFAIIWGICFYTYYNIAMGGYHPQYMELWKVVNFGLFFSTAGFFIAPVFYGIVEMYVEPGQNHD